MKRLLSIVSIVLCLSVLTACGGGSEPAPEVTATPEATAQTQMDTVTIYTVDASTMQLIPSKVMTETGEENIANICDLVVKNLEDDGISVVEAKMEDETGVVVFDSTGKPLVDCDEEMESLILECFVNSIFENIDECQDVIFRTDKGAYISEHMELGENDVYATK